MKVLVTGSSGFICSYLVERLLNDGHEVIGLDMREPNRPFKNHPKFTHITCDLRDQSRTSRVSFNSIDYAFLGACSLGGIAFFHKYPYKMINDNESIMCNTMDLIVRTPMRAFCYISSSMVYESATKYPVSESDLVNIPAPKSHYGFQKLAGEFHASAVSIETGIPHTIVRPFNAVGCNESLNRISDIGMTHVLPEMVYRALTTEGPMGILGSGEQIRSFTHGKDIARALVTIMNEPKALGESFNISSSSPTKMSDLAQMVWKRIHGTNVNLIHWPSYEHDVKVRIPDTSKAKEILGFETEISLEDSIDEVINHIKDHLGV